MGSGKRLSQDTTRLRNRTGIQAGTDMITTPLFDRGRGYPVSLDSVLMVHSHSAAVANLYSITTNQAAISALFGAKDISLSLLTARIAKPSQNGLVWRQKATFFT